MGAPHLTTASSGKEDGLAFSGGGEDEVPCTLQVLELMQIGS